MPHDKIELRPAYVWTCPECGRDSFVQVAVAPEQVSCYRCDRSFDTTFAKSEEEEES